MTFAVTTSVGTNAVVALSAVDTVERFQPGYLVEAVDPYWGSGEFIYVKAGGTIAQYAPCVILPTFNATTKKWEYIATAVPNTANLGKEAGIAQGAATVGQYLWLMVTGVTPAASSASVAADTAIGITGAGTLGANSAGKQLLNARCVGAATITVVKANSNGLAGSYQIDVGNSDGFFLGAYVSGTGVAAGAYITAISPDGRFITVSAVNTAIVSGSVTATYNNATIFYNVVQLNRSFYQGAIT